jgi:putative PIG3 family NAD(P)H quinone oxidoreductase
VKAILVKTDGSQDLYWGDAPMPGVAPETVLVEVRATAVNRADLLQRRGLYPPPPGESNIMGLEVSGVVAATGDKAGPWRVGDRVCCLLAGGGYAEYVTVHHAMLLPIPDGIDFEHAAAIPEAFYTAFVNLALEGRLAAGERLLIHAGASGVGTAAIQLARHLGARIYVTAGTDEKLRRCIELGAHAGINYKTEDFGERLATLTEGEGVDVVLDCVGGPYLERHLSLLRTRGRLVIIGLMGGARTEINLAPVVGKRLRLIGSVLRSRTLAEKIELTDAFTTEVWPLFETGKLHPVVDVIYPLTDAVAAHQHVAANKNFGKVVLRVV